MNQAAMARLAKQDEQHARLAFDQCAARVENLKRDLSNPCVTDRGRYIDNKAAIARELVVAITAKALAEKEWRSARRVRKGLAGDNARRRSSVVWL
jgi:hypothetical protein